jgi:hypothetical protein
VHFSRLMQHLLQEILFLTLICACFWESSSIWLSLPPDQRQSFKGIYFDRSPGFASADSCAIPLLWTWSESAAVEALAMVNGYDPWSINPPYT